MPLSVTIFAYLIVSRKKKRGVLLGMLRALSQFNIDLVSFLAEIRQDWGKSVTSLLLVNRSSPSLMINSTGTIFTPWVLFYGGEIIINV
jgi:hypothetical protein